MPSETRDDANPIKKPKLCFPLHSAIEAGDKEFVEKLFRYNGVPDINACNEKGLTPLQVAVLYKHQNIIEFLLNNGANVNAKTNEQKAGDLLETIKLNESYYISPSERKCYSKLTALFIAIINGSQVIIRMLIENGADVNLENDHYLSPIHCAVFNGCFEIVSLLFENGAKIDKTSEQEFVDDEDNIYFIDCLEDHQWLDASLNTIFYDLGNAKIFEQLIKNGVDANHDFGSYSLLQSAVVCNNFAMVKILVKNGANLEFLCSNQQENYGETALHFAMNQDPISFEIARFLIKHGCDVNHQSELTHDEVNSYSTPLHLAALNGSQDTAELLLRSGASSNIRNGLNKTPLDMAVTFDDAMIRTLLLNGADPEDRCTCGICYPCPLKSYELALEMKDTNSLKIFFHTTHSF